MTSSYRRHRMPMLKKQITGWMLHEVRNRHKNALMEAGGEPCLLYIPTGVKSGADWDEVRQSYLKEDIEYTLYLNRQLDQFGQRIYTNDTDLVPSILVAFPLNPDKEMLSEQGFTLSNESNAWTLWNPVIPDKGCIIVRNDKATGQLEYWLVGSVLHSTFPYKPRDMNYLLHQEFQLEELTKESMHVDLSQLKSVEETLTRQYYPLETSSTGLSVSSPSSSIANNFLNITDSCTIQELDNLWVFGSLSFILKNTSFQGFLDVYVANGSQSKRIGVRFRIDSSDQTIVSVVGILFQSNLIQQDEFNILTGEGGRIVLNQESFSNLNNFILQDGSKLLKVDNSSFLTNDNDFSSYSPFSNFQTLQNNVQYKITVTVNEPFIVIKLNDTILSKFSLLPEQAYQENKPLLASSSTIKIEGNGLLSIKNLRQMEIL